MMEAALDRLLVSLAVRLRSFAVCAISPGWRIAFDPMEAVTIHYVLDGQGSLAVPGHPPLAFAPLTLMMVPAGRHYSLGDPEGRETLKGEAHCRLLGDGLIAFEAGGAPAIRSICGAIVANYPLALGLFEGAPGPLAFDLRHEPEVMATFEVIVRELAAPSVGTQALTESMMRACLIWLLRKELRQPEGRSALLGPLADPSLASAVVAVLNQPAERHSLESLARLAGMSRTVFAKRFAAAFGTTPIAFVQMVRLRLAAQMLDHTDLPIKVVAASVGFGNRSHFSRAFRAAYGLDPSAYRALGGQAEAEPEPVEGGVKAMQLE